LTIAKDLYEENNHCKRRQRKWKSMD